MGGHFKLKLGGQYHWNLQSDALRGQLAGKFYDLGWLKKIDNEGNSIVLEKAKYPKVGILNTGFSDEEELNFFIEKCQYCPK